ncbi:MAG TPA: TipAS antibiotic-recognition domain-containing protein, partial [Bacillaceae bacterium]
RRDALELQRKMLLEKRARLNKMSGLVEKTIRHTEGEIHMSNKEKFEGFDFTHNPYEQEARDRWGDEAVDKSIAKAGKISKEQQKAVSEAWNTIYTRLAGLRHGSPESEEAQEAIKEWYTFLNSNFGSYSYEAFKGLGQLYVDDERFTKNIDQYGGGLAAFMRDAMAIFADRNK